jgi:hypothetical protein
MPGEGVAKITFAAEDVECGVQEISELLDEITKTEK